MSVPLDSLRLMTINGSDELVHEIDVDVIRIRITRWATEPLPYVTHLVTPLGSNFYSDYVELGEAVADAETLAEEFRSDDDREAERQTLLAVGASPLLMDGAL